MRMEIAMNLSKIIGRVILGALLLLLLYLIFKPAPKHTPFFTPGGPEDQEMSRVIQENQKLWMQQEKIDKKFDQQRERNEKAMDDMLFNKNRN